MRILFLHEVNYLTKPIFEMHEFPEHLAARGHEVGFVHFPEGFSRGRIRELGWKEEIAGRVLPDISLTLYTPQNSDGSLIGRLITAATFKSTFTRIIEDFHPDIVVSYSVPTSGWQAVSQARRIGVPILFRALDVSHKIRKSVFSPLTLMAEKYIYQRATLISTNNPALAEYCDSLGGQATKSVVDLPPLDLEHFAAGRVQNAAIRAKLGIRHDDFVILYMGSFFYFSGLPRLIREFSKLKAGHMKLVLVGGGEQEQELRELVANLNLSSSVIFTGFVSFADLPGYLAAANVAVNPMLPSLVSNAAFPNKVIQYLGAGLSVATTRLKGLEMTFGEVRGISYADAPEGVMQNAVEMFSRPDFDTLGEGNMLLVSKFFSKDGAVDAFESRLNSLVPSHD